MAKKQVDECVQCMGDEMLEVRKDAGLLHEIMGLLSDEYKNKHKPHTTPVDYVRALIDAERDHRRLREMIKSDAERKTKEIGDLIAALRFVSDATKNGSSGVAVGGSALTINVSQLIAVAIQRIQHIEASYRGLLQGMQPHNERDFMADLFQPVLPTAPQNK